MKLLLIIIVIFGLVGFAFYINPKDKPEVKSVKTEAVSPVIVKQPEMPVKLTIPTLQVEAAVEMVGMDSEGRMDIPKNADNVAWYNLGSKPGEKGNAVIAGHFDKANGDPAVFNKITSLSVGDEIITTDAVSKEYAYTVVKIEHYPYNKFPLQEVFGSSENSMLNLITCSGEWDKTTKNYAKRTVVYSRLVK